MKTHSTNSSACGFKPCPRARQSGVSVLIIMALLACMAILVAANSTTLAVLKQELNTIDQRQQQRHGQNPGH